MIRNRPAETGTVALGVFAAALAKALGLSADWQTVLILGLSGAPAAITWLAVRWNGRNP